MERAALPPADYDNVANRLGAASAAVIDGAFGVASEDIEAVARYELAQLHGVEGGLVFPAPVDTRKSALLATILTLSHFLARAKVGRCRFTPVLKAPGLSA